MFVHFTSFYLSVCSRISQQEHTGAERERDSERGELQCRSGRSVHQIDGSSWVAWGNVSETVDGVVVDDEQEERNEERKNET